MKTKHTFFSISIVLIATVLISFYPSGSPGGYTNSPADGHNCSVCHGGSVNNVDNYISTNIPPEGYTAGQEYEIVVSYNQSGKKGFELTCEDNTNAKVGQFASGSGTKLTNGGHAVTHTNGVNSTTATWTFNWTAPASGVGEVTFYSALARTDNYTKLCSLVIPQKVNTSLDQVDGFNFSIYPNPASDYIIVNSSDNEIREIFIYSIDGKLCKSAFVKGEAKIDISELNPNIYTLVFNQDGKNNSYKFIVK